MSVRNWLRQSILDAAKRSSVPAAEESKVVLKDAASSTRTPTAPRAVEHVSKLPPEVLTATHDVAYDWDYTVKRTDLRNLYEKSKDLMWNARTDLDWSIDVDPEREIV